MLEKKVKIDSEEIGCYLEKIFKIEFHTDWKNVQKSINVQGQIRSCRVEVGPKLNKACSTFIRHTREIGCQKSVSIGGIK